MEFGTFILFAITTFVVVFSPGPAAITVTAQGSGNGLGRAQFGIIGIASANVIYFALSATGIASLIIASNTLFTIIKWVGVAYLAYLGLNAIFSKTGALKVERRPKEARKTLFAKGFIVEFANPKALLYFAAILPQFLDPSAPIAPQIAIMGLTTLVMDVVVYSAYAFLGQTITQSGVRPWIVKTLNRTAGSALLFAAFKMVRVSN
ncbi:MAG: LysE family translocator [Pseudomonadota bacterium]